MTTMETFSYIDCHIMPTVTTLTIQLSNGGATVYFTPKMSAELAIAEIRRLATMLEDKLRAQREENI
jgi:hypothetical protein